MNNAYDVLGKPESRREYDLNAFSTSANNYNGNEHNSSSANYDNIVNVTMRDFFNKSNVSEE